MMRIKWFDGIKFQLKGFSRKPSMFIFRLMNLTVDFSPSKAFHRRPLTEDRGNDRTGKIFSFNEVKWFDFWVAFWFVHRPGRVCGRGCFPREPSSLRRLIRLQHFFLRHFTLICISVQLTNSRTNSFYSLRIRTLKQNAVCDRYSIG